MNNTKSLLMKNAVSKICDLRAQGKFKMAIVFFFNNNNNNNNNHFIISSFEN
jgi:hypothetical protein